MLVRSLPRLAVAASGLLSSVGAFLKSMVFHATVTTHYRSIASLGSMTVTLTLVTPVYLNKLLNFVRGHVQINPALNEEGLRNGFARL